MNQGLEGQPLEHLVEIADRHTNDPFPIGAMAVTIRMRSDLGKPITLKMQTDFLSILTRRLQETASTDGAHDKLIPPTLSYHGLFYPGDEYDY